MRHISVFVYKRLHLPSSYQHLERVLPSSLPYQRNTGRYTVDSRSQYSTMTSPLAKTTAPAASRQQPPWTQPVAPHGIDLPPLSILNSLTRKKETFVPIDQEGKKVTWYTCGPTVYDDAHLGHARNYVSTDIIRRIMKDYFEFDVKFVMNITDIDDKIVLRGRQQYLLQQFLQNKNPNNTISDESWNTALAAFSFYVKKNLPLVPTETTLETFSKDIATVYGRVLEGKNLDSDEAPPSDREAKIKMHINAVTEAIPVLTSSSRESLPKDAFFARIENILLPYLDSLEGANVDSQNHSIFLSLTKKFEDRFFEDMKALNVLYPDQVTRVTEYVPQIVSFTEQIIKNGFGYATADGSVYFDITSYEQAGHHYACLAPWNRNDKSLLADGEGSLASKNIRKKSDGDFALWKASKAGEPAWPSPWGPGRPGWHIECSVMASEVLGNVIDLHSGGIDLRFPHHDNELAQATAYWATPQCGNDQWINYFIHMGHLSIQGLKMSKSLKNYTTIRSALQQKEWTSRLLRITFLMGQWQDGIEVTDDLMKSTAAWEEKLNNFFLKADDFSRHPEYANSIVVNEAVDQQVRDAFVKAKLDLHNALCDSFNTPIAMRVISELVTEINSAKGLSMATTLEIARWITRIVTIFGLDAEGDLQDEKRIAWSGISIPEAAYPSVSRASQLRNEVRALVLSGSINHDEIASLAQDVSHLDINAAEESQPYVAVLTQFRNQVANLAAKQAPAKEYLTLCDELRDSQLWNLGIYLEDREAPLSALIRPVDNVLQSARAEREAAAAAKEAAKAQREAEAAEKQRLVDEKSKVSHLEMFKTAEYSAWDEDGVPTKDAQGEDVPKSKSKKLRKEWERQKKLHETWLAKQK